MAQLVSKPYLIIGAGAMGSAAAYHLTRKGFPIVLLEQFELGHNRGSSHGAARIIRHSYSDPYYAHLMVDAFRAWRALEADSCQSITIKTGGVSFCPREVDYVARVAAGLAAVGVEHRRLAGSEFSRLVPQFRLPADFDVVYEPDAGVINAAVAIRAQMELARSRGAEIRANCPVRSIQPEGDHVIVTTDDLIYKVDRVILTLGAWTGALRPKLASLLKPTRQRVLYYQPTVLTNWSIGRFPVFISMGATPDDAHYGMPADLGMGVKVAQHWGPEVDPDNVDRLVEDDYRRQLRRFLTNFVPELAESPVERAEVCLYTVTRDEDFRVDFDPDSPNIIVASPCSGHGFKFSCLIGEILADLAILGTTWVDIARWKFRAEEVKSNN